MIGEKILTNSGSMGPGVILLENLVMLDGQRRGERFADACVLERDRFGGGSVMVWGGISHGLKSPLIVITGNLTGVQAI
jgi:hypothetical protein